MLKWLEIIVRTIVSTLCTQRSLAIENLVLRQQLAVLKHRHPRPRLTDADRLFWVVLSRIWAGWRGSLHIVQPETVVRWHRQGFRYYWRWKSRHRGRPRIDPEIRQLIRRMCRANPLWGAKTVIRSPCLSRSAGSSGVVAAYPRTYVREKSACRNIQPPGPHG